MTETHIRDQDTVTPPRHDPADAPSKDDGTDLSAHDENAIPPANTTEDDRQWRKRDVIREGFRNKTRGEAWFNKISYIGFGYGLVTATSVFLTWLINDTRQFADRYAKFAGTLTKKFRIAPTFSNIVTLFIGGTIASVLPVKWLEDHKPDIVKKLDRFLYTDEELKDPKIEAAHKELEELPKQTWISVVSSRVVAFGATLAVFLAMGSNKSPLYQLSGKSIDKSSIQFGRWFDRLIHRNNPAVQREIDTAIATNLERMNGARYGNDALKDLQLVRGAGGDRVASRVWSYIGLDMFYTLFTSAALFIFTRVFGGLWGKPQSPEAEQPKITPQHTAFQSPEYSPTATQGKSFAKTIELQHSNRINAPEKISERTV